MAASSHFRANHGLPLLLAGSHVTEPRAPVRLHACASLGQDLEAGTGVGHHARRYRKDLADFRRVDVKVDYFL